MRMLSSLLMSFLGLSHSSLKFSIYTVYIKKFSEEVSSILTAGLNIVALSYPMSRTVPFFFH